MAVIMEFTAEQQKEFESWVASKPPLIQEMIRKLPPNRLYRNKTTGQRVMIHSYEEDGTVTVVVSGRFNLCAFERNVFGVAVEDLEECDLPGESVPVGAMLTEPAEIDKFIELARPVVLKERENEERK